MEWMQLLDLVAIWASDPLGKFLVLILLESSQNHRQDRRLLLKIIMTVESVQDSGMQFKAGHRWLFTLPRCVTSWQVKATLSLQFL